MRFDKTVLASLKREEAFSYLEGLAHAGDFEAMLVLADSYIDGRYSPVNKEMSISIYSELANSGNSAAALQLGGLFEESVNDGFTENKDLMIHWYKEAFARGSKKAAYFLGSAYEDEEIFNNSKKEAVEWYEVGCKHNDIESICALAEFYIKSKDYHKAFKTLEKHYSSNARIKNLILSLRGEYRYASPGFINKVKGDAATELKILFKNKAVVVGVSATLFLILVLAYKFIRVFI